MKIKQKKHDNDEGLFVYYSTVIWEDGMPIITAYGKTQEEADTKAITSIKEELK